jgi:integrase
MCRGSAGGSQKGKRRAKRRDYVYLTHGQVLTLASEAGRWRLLILLLAYTGLRWGEATALRVCDIDFDRRRVNVSRAFSDVGGRVVLGTPKSHQSRTVPVPPFIAIELAGAVDSQRPDDLIFTMPGGSVMRMSNWRRATFVPARARAGLSDRFRVHDLRHTAASLRARRLLTRWFGFRGQFEPVGGGVSGQLG